MQNVREEERSEHPLKRVKAMKIENIRTAGSGCLRGSFLVIRVIFLFKISSPLLILLYVVDA